MSPALNKPGIRLLSGILGASGLILALLLSVGQTKADRGDAQPQASPRTHSLATTLQAPGDCGPETYPRILSEEHVEAGSPGWAHSGTPGDLWEISSWRPFSGTYSWYAPAPATVNDHSLFSPSVFLPENELPISLRYWGYQDFEFSEAGCYDGALLEISSDGGQSWIQLVSQLLTDPYDGLIDPTSQNPLAGKPAWCGHPQDWFESIVDLDEFAGQTVQFRFRVGTDNSLSREGWYLDDISIQSCPSAFIAVMDSESFQTGMPGEQVKHDIRLENQGLDDQYTFQLLAGDWPASLETSALVTLLSGQVFTATVLVDLPAAPGGQWIEDTFLLEAKSMGNPDLILQTAGTSELRVTPSLILQPDQVYLVGDPGETITHTFWLTNTGDTEDNFHLVLEDIEWPTYVSPKSGLMQTGETKAIHALVTIPIGPLDTVGTVITDSFTLRVESGWTAQINAVVFSTSRADLVAGLRLEAPIFLDAFAGHSIELVITIANLGNFADRYLLEWTGDWLAETPVGQSPWIPPGELGEIPVRISIPLQIQDGEISSISLTATSQLDPKKRGMILLTIQGWKRIFLPLIYQ